MGAVYVRVPDKSGGQRVQDVTINYNYIGILHANLLYDIMNGKAAWTKSCRFPKTLLYYFIGPPL